MKLVASAGRAAAAFALTLTLASPATSQERQDVPDGSLIPETGIGSSSNRYKLKVEVKVNGRSTQDEPFTFMGGSATAPVTAQQVSPQSSFEISNVAIIGEGDFTPHLSGRAVIHFIDLYTRNPTATGAAFSVREAWLRFGKKYEPLQAMPGTSVYLQAGRAPRFHKQTARRMESYGLWGTAIARLEEIGVEAGGSFGRNVYWRGAVSNGNPLYIRDPNALAGNNQAIDRTNAAPATSGYPILYEARPDDFNSFSAFQYGGGLGARFSFGQNDRNGVDLVGWVFKRRLRDRPSSELDLLRGFGATSLPLQGTGRLTYGANLEVRLGEFQLHGQYVRDEFAELERKGFEAEVAYRFQTGGLFVSGDSPAINWFQPVLRVSRIDNGFSAAGFFAPSVTWNWTKYDAGLRVGIIRGMDLTMEYAYNVAQTARGDIHPNEFLATLRFLF